MTTEADHFPQTLQEAMAYFADPEKGHKFMVCLRWPEGKVTCPHCQSEKVSFLSTRQKWKCMNKECHKQFSAKVGTIFEDSALGYDKWFPAIWLISNCKNGISSYELASALGVTQKTAWFMLHRIRLAMQTGSFEKMSGEVEADETFIGGLAKFMHKERNKRRGRGTGHVGKEIVLGLLERGEVSRVRAIHVRNRRRHVVEAEVRQAVEQGAEVFTDALPSYSKLSPDFLHQFIDHAEAYVNGKVHTNGMENFWSLLKRGIKGTYVSVEPFHLFRYLDEQAFRFNERKESPAGRFVKAAAGIIGKLLRYEELIGGKGGEDLPLSEATAG